MNVKPKPKYSKEPLPKLTTSSPTCCKPHVGSSAFEVVKNYWICVHSSGMVALESLAYSKPQSIKNKLATWSKNKPISKWRYWKHRDWKCVKVNVNFSQLNK